MERGNAFGNQKFLTEQINEISVVKVKVLKVTLNETQAFKQVLDSLVSTGHHKIIVDFGECTFADSPIRGVIVYAANKLNNVNGEIRVVATKDNIYNIFAMTGLSKLISRYKSLKEALENF